MTNNNNTKYYVMRESHCFWVDIEYAVCDTREKAEQIAKALNSTIDKETEYEYYVCEW